MTHRANYVASWGICESSSGCLSQAISLQHIDSHVAKVARNLRIEPRAARDQVAHAAAEQVVNFPKENSSGVYPDPPYNAIHLHENPKPRLSAPATRGNFFEDSLMDQIEELRHYRECRNLSLLQRSQQFRRVQGLQIHNSRSASQWQQQVRHLRQHVKHREHA